MSSPSSLANPANLSAGIPTITPTIPDQALPGQHCSNIHNRASVSANSSLPIPVQPTSSTIGNANGSGPAQPLANPISAGGSSNSVNVSGNSSFSISSQPTLSPIGNANGSGPAQPQANPIGISRSSASNRSNISGASSEVDVNTFALANDPLAEQLQPMDQILENPIPDTTPKAQVLALLRFYSFEAAHVRSPGSSDVDISAVNILLARLRDIRQGRINFAALGFDDQQSLATFCGIPFPDDEQKSIAAGVALFTKYFVPSLVSVATQDDETWDQFTIRGLRAHLGIMGIENHHISKKIEIRARVQTARALLVYQGILVPEMRKPFTAVTYPDLQILMQTSGVFKAALVASMLDPDSSTLPHEDLLSQTLHEFRGPTVDLSFFDHALWTKLTGAFDRRVFLHCFLGVSGVAFELTGMLSAEDLLPLLPEGGLTAVPFQRARTSLGNTPPATRKRRLWLDTICGSGQAAAPQVIIPVPPVDTIHDAHSTASMSIPSTGTSSSNPSRAHPLLPTTWSQPVQQGLFASPFLSGSAAYRAPTAGIPPSASNHIPPCLPTNSGPAQLSGMQVGGYGQTWIGGSPPGLTNNDIGAMGQLAETRFITDNASIGTEYSLASLESLPVYTIRALLAHTYKTDIQRVPRIPEDMSVTHAVALLWNQHQLRGFRYLINKTQRLCTHSQVGHETLVPWPGNYTACTVRCEVNGQILEARYSLRPNNHDPFRPAYASLIAGNQRSSRPMVLCSREIES